MLAGTPALILLAHFNESCIVTFPWDYVPVSYLSGAEVSLTSDFFSSGPLKTFSLTNRSHSLNVSSVSSDSSLRSCYCHSQDSGHPVDAVGLCTPPLDTRHQAARAFGLDITNCGLGMHPIKRHIRYTGFSIFSYLHM